MILVRPVAAVGDEAGAEDQGGGEEPVRTEAKAKRKQCHGKAH